jgi:hypothetical protein
MQRDVTKTAMSQLDQLKDAENPDSQQVGGDTRMEGCDYATCPSASLARSRGPRIPSSHGLRRRR